MRSTLGEVLGGLDKFDWKQWVYILRGDGISAATSCIVLDPDAAELGLDDFTPVEVESAGMEEFLSVHDLMAIQKNLNMWQSEPPLSEKCRASVYYFENDAFMPKTNE